MAGFHRHAARLCAAAEGLAQHVGQVDHAGAARHAGYFELPGARVRHLDLDLLVVEFTGAQLAAEGVARRLAGVRSHQRVDHAALRIELRLCFHVLAARGACHGDAGFDEVAHDLVHVAANVTNLGELGGFHFQEWRVGELGKAAGDLRLAHAGGADHEDVLRHHLVTKRAFQLLAAPAVPERDGDGALGFRLADDVAVQFRDDLAGGKIGHVRSQAVASVSTVRLLFV